MQVSGTEVPTAVTPSAPPTELTGAALVLLGGLAMLGVVTLNVSLSSHLTAFYGLCFVLMSATIALVAGRQAFFAAGVLPPMLMFGAIGLVALTVPEALVVEGLRADASLLQRVVAGAVDNAAALVVGHMLALMIVASRIASSED